MIVGSRQTPSKFATSTFDIRSIERISGLTERQIQRVAQYGFISSLSNEHNRAPRLSFQEVLVLRKIGQLISTQCSLTSVLSQLRDILASGPTHSSLHTLDVKTIGPHLVIQVKGVLQHITSGQTFLNFGEEGTGQHSAVLQFPSSFGLCSAPTDVTAIPASEIARMSAAEELSSQDWFKLGLQLESLNENSRAQNAYRNAIGLDEDNVDAIINLGRLLQLDDKFRAAKKLYEKVLKLRPESELANFNMGTLFDMLDEFELAIKYYERAPNLAMAHQNLARIYDLMGNDVLATRHTLRKHELDQE